MLRIYISLFLLTRVEAVATSVVCGLVVDADHLQLCILLLSILESLMERLIATRRVLHLDRLRVYLLRLSVRGEIQTKGAR